MAEDSADRRGYDRRRGERDRALLTDQIITAEQEERRRLALFLHDGPVQSLAGIALMLDAVVHTIDAGQLDDAKRVLGNALELQRETIRSLRDLSFNLEPVVLRDQGFGSAVRALADQVELSHRIAVDLDVDAADDVAEQAQVALYQIVREAVNQAVLRGPPTKVAITISRTDDGGLEARVVDDGAGERRRSGVEVLQARARTLGGDVTAEPRAEGGTAFRVVLPAYAVRG